MRLLLFYIVFVALPGVITTANAGTPFSKDIWLNETNVPVKVNCLQKDADGYMWLGTDEGLYRYNGRSFTRISTPTDEPVTALIADGHRLLVGFGKGSTGIWDGNNFYLNSLTGNTPGEAISSIHVVAGNLWLLSTVGEGLFLVQGNYCTRYTMDNGLTDDYVYTALSPAKNTLLAATDQGINEVKIRQGNFDITHFTTSKGLPDNIVRVIRPMTGKCWSWIGTHQGGVALYCSKNRVIWTPHTNRQWEWGQVNDILPIGDARAWVCTENGFLLHLKLVGADSLEVEVNRYPGQKLYKLLMGETGNIWCATNGGLKVIVSEYMESVKLPHPYSLSQLTAITCDDTNTVWLAQKNILYSFSATEKMPTLRKKFTAPADITNLYYDRRGGIWLGTFGKGLWHSYDGIHFKQTTNIPPLQNESVLDIAADESVLWISGLNGVEELTYLQNRLSLVRIHNKNTGIGSDYVYKIFPDSKGRIWMATDGAGVCMYQNGKYTLWDSASGMHSRVIYNMAEDEQGNIWASTFDKGLLVFDGTQWVAVGRDNGLQSLKIATIAPAPNGRVLVVHAKGIDEWQHLSRDFRHYERRLGVGIDSVSSALNLFFRDTAGNTCIPYQDGLIFFGGHEYTTNIIPSIFIRSLKTYFRETRLERKTFGHNENHISFLYEGINYANPEQLFYRYKLEGYNSEWILTRDESVTFPQLTSGSYKFVVQVSMNSMFTSYGEAIHNFSIAKPYWQELWFILLMLLLLWVVAYTYIRIRENNLRKLSALQRERMMFEYEHLKSQVNPHFLFNSLNTLTGLIEDDRQLAIQYTTQLSDLYRNMLSHKDKDLIPLAEEWKILQNYIYIQKSRFGDALQLVVNIPDNLMNRKVVPMALQLLLENAIKHNIVSKSNPLVVTFEADDSQLMVSNTYQPKMSKEKGAGLGLANIRKRYALHTRSHVLSRIENKKFIVVIPLI